MSHIIFGTFMLLLAGTLAFKHHGGPRFWGLRRLIRGLDATPAQEKAIRDLIIGASDQLKGLRRDGVELRRQWSEVLRSATIDDGRLADAEAQIGSKLQQAGGVLRTTLIQIHEVLDARQREKLADWVATGPHCHKYGCC